MAIARAISAPYGEEDVGQEEEDDEGDDCGENEGLELDVSMLYLRTLALVVYFDDGHCCAHLDSIMRLARE